MKFGEKVRDLRKKHSLTQDELAKCLGVSKRTIIGWERDGRYPRNVEILEKMADIFHVPLLSFIPLSHSSPDFSAYPHPGPWLQTHSSRVAATESLPNYQQSARPPLEHKL